MIQTLVLCEKPDAAARVARALDSDGDPRVTSSTGVPLYVARRGRDTILVCSAIGHLYGVDSKTLASRRFYPVWDRDWRPSYLIDRKSTRFQRWISVIRAVAKKADRYVNACDYDVEGSVIGYTVLRYAGDGVEAKAQRMKFSTMTEREIQLAYQALAPELDFAQSEAGMCRHELDWLYGINLSRLLTESALKQNRGYATLSTGRVQGPTLKFVVEREGEIQCFVPIPFWTIEAAIRHEDQTLPLEFEEDKILQRTIAQRITEDCENAELTLDSRETRTKQQLQPHPFDLASLQSEAFRHFGYTPSRTLAIAEKLYLEALISYPRTSSQRLFPDIGYSGILKGIARQPQYRLLATKLANQTTLQPNQGSKQDPAHPAIYPTGEIATRAPSQPEANLLDLIIRRFMATFAETSLQEVTVLAFKKDQYKFFLKGLRILRDGWIEYYRPYISDDSKELPNLKIGDVVTIWAIRAPQMFTRPPSRFNPSSLLRKMEDANIGTKATRAHIIQTLYDRGYVRDIRIQATHLAQRVIEVLENDCPAFLDPLFTSRLERQMEEIQTGRTTRNKVLAQGLEDLRSVMFDLMVKEDDIGSQLSEVVVSQKISSLTFDNPCPKCDSSLVIVRSRTTRKRFIGCTGYDRGCQFTLPLPQFGALTITRQSCKTCGFQLVRTWSKGRALVSCPRCYSNRRDSHAKLSQQTRPRVSRSSRRDLLESTSFVENQ